MPKKVTKPMVMATARLRETPICSMQNEMPVSLSEMVEVRDAISNRRKKIIDQTSPKGIWRKMSGSTTNTNFGPASGCIPNEKTAGKMMIPAMMATMVSRPAMMDALLTIFVWEGK